MRVGWKIFHPVNFEKNKLNDKIQFCFVLFLLTSQGLSVSDRKFTFNQLSLVMRKNKYTMGKPVPCRMTDGWIDSLQRQSCFWLSRQF